MMLKQEATGTRTLPDFVIIGAQRSGSTALASYLRSHPQVFMPTKKEIHYFDVNFDRGTEWYARQFRDAGSEHVVGEATPVYMYHDQAIPRMASLVPNALLIAILRNPVDRAYSHYWMNRARGHETLNFMDAIVAEPERLASDEPFVRVGKSYMDRGRYLRQLLRVREHFPRDALHVILFEDMRGDAAGTYRGLCRFLGVDQTFLPQHLGVSVAHFSEFRSTTLFRINRRLPRRLRQVGSRLNIRKAHYPPMEPSVRASLLESFKDDNEALASWLGRDLSVWQS
jgi:hypothetical protein